MPLEMNAARPLKGTDAETQNDMYVQPASVYIHESCIIRRVRAHSIFTIPRSLIPLYWRGKTAPPSFVQPDIWRFNWRRGRTSCFCLFFVVQRPQGSGRWAFRKGAFGRARKPKFTRLVEVSSFSRRFDASRFNERFCCFDGRSDFMDVCLMVMVCDLEQWGKLSFVMC